MRHAWVRLVIVSVLLVTAPFSSSFANEVPLSQVRHVLDRIAFGPRPGDIAQVQQMGLDAYIEQQLSPETIPLPKSLTDRLAAMSQNDMTQADLIKNWRRVAVAAVRDTSGGGPGTPIAVRNAYYKAMTVHFGELRLVQAIDSPRQLNEVMVNFWFNHFNVVNNKRVTRVLIGDYERQAIRPYVLGKFRDMLGAVTKHPAMLFYLDNWVSSAPGAEVYIPGTKRRVSGINENFARELMELHTLGVNGGYTQADVTTLARILTGWTFTPRGSDPRATFMFAPQMHDDGAKVWLGQTVSVTGQAQGEWALDVLARHPATARYISFKLAQYFVSDDPPQALVDRMAHQFLATDGDIREVMRVLLKSAEFRSPEAMQAKFKTPYEYVISAVRARGGEVNNTRPLLLAMSRMGMPLHRCGSPDGYKNTQATWLSPGAIAQRIEFATGLALGRMRLSAFPKRLDPEGAGSKVLAMMPATLTPASIDQTLGSVAAQDDPVAAARLTAVLGEQSEIGVQVALADQNRLGLGAALILGSPTFMRR